MGTQRFTVALEGPESLSLAERVRITGVAPVGPRGAPGEVTQAELDAAVADKVASADVTTIDVLTQAAYDALTPPDPAVLYVIEG